MSSIKCRRCGLTNWAHEPQCKRCKTPLGQGEPAAAAPQIPRSVPQQLESASHPAIQAQPGHQPQPDPYIQTDNQPQPQFQAAAPAQWAQPQQQANLKTGIAVASMVVGIVAFVTTLLLVGVLIAPIGLVLGIVALVKAKRYPLQYGGKGFAIAGVIVSALVTLWIPLIAAIAIPNLMAARRHANEGSAISTMRKLLSAQQAFAQQFEGGRCADLPQLVKLGSIDRELSTGKKSGYMYFVDNYPDGGCEMHAIPLSQSSGTRSFYLSTNDGMIRHATRGGKRANSKDEVLGEAPRRQIAMQED